MDGNAGATTATVDGNRLTLSEAAQLLGVSEKTTRRWIKSGKLAADLEEGPYGLQYWVSTQVVQAAQQVLAVVKVEEPADPQTLALAIGQALDRRDQALRDQLVAQHAAVLAELASIRALLERQPAPPPPDWCAGAQMQNVSNLHGAVQSESASNLLAGEQMQSTERTTCNPPASTSWWKRWWPWVHR